MALLLEIVDLLSNVSQNRYAKILLAFDCSEFFERIKIVSVNLFAQ